MAAFCIPFCCCIDDRQRLTAHQKVCQRVPQGGQAPFAQEGRVVNLVDAHVRTPGEILALAHAQVGAPLRNHLASQTGGMALARIACDGSTLTWKRRGKHTISCRENASASSTQAGRGREPPVFARVSTESGRERGIGDVVRLRRSLKIFRLETPNQHVALVLDKRYIRSDHL